VRGRSAGLFIAGSMEGASMVARADDSRIEAR